MTTRYGYASDIGRYNRQRVATPRKLAYRRFDHARGILRSLEKYLLISQSLSLRSHLKLVQADLLEFDHSVSGSHWRW